MAAMSTGAGASISLCMIVRDEEQRLARCLASVAGVADELVVCDTGSSDRTRDVARAAGARLVEEPWNDDFAAARNRSLAEARGDWILVLDADEVLVPEGARERLQAFAAAAARLPLHGGQLELENRTADGRSRILLTRFFPRLPGLRYVRRIHEQLVHADRPVPGRPTGVRALHDGYQPRALAERGKLARNEALLRAQLADDPSDGYDWYQLGRTLEAGQRFAEALEAYERAVERVRDDDPHLPHLFECAATCLRRLERSRQALDWLAGIEEAFAERPDTVFLMALLAMDVGELERAERGFRRCLELGRAGPPASAAESSLQARGVAPAHNLGVLYECSGRGDEARTAYELALSFQPDHAPSRAGLARLLAAARPGP